MVEYRPFHNSDPPKLVSVWHQCGLGRGAADGFSYDAFETLILSQTYFDPNGLIVACEDAELVGFAHAGFGCNAEQTGLNNQDGVICALMVLPHFRRRGIGRELLRRAEAYLQSKGATTIDAGPAAPRDPFYVGLYGGSEPPGFLESDPHAAPFFTANGYEPNARHFVYQRDLAVSSDPVSLRLVTVRRRMELAVTNSPRNASWWWYTRYGRWDSVEFQLIPKSGGSCVARATVVGLDLYLRKWQQRAVGITDLLVTDLERRKGYAQALVLEICKRLREELILRVEAHAPEENTQVIGLIGSCGFSRIDVGVVYRKKS